MQSSASTEPRPFQLPLLSFQRGGWGAPGAGGAQPGQLTQTGQRDVPYHMATCSAIKAVVKEQEGGDNGSDGVCLPKKSLHVLSPAFLGVAEPLPANGK